MNTQNTKLAPQPPKDGVLESVKTWKAILWLPPILYMIFIYYLSSGPITVDINPFDLPYIDKILHFLAYGLLAILLYIPIKVNFSKYHRTLTLLLVILYGITDEIHQYFTPSRQFDLLDWLADMIGGIVGIIFIELIIWFYQKLHKNKNK